MVKPPQLPEREKDVYNELMGEYIEVNKLNIQLKAKFDDLKRVIKAEKDDIKDAKKIVKLRQLKKKQDQIK